MDPNAWPTIKSLVEIVEREVIAMEIARQTKPRPAHVQDVHLRLDQEIKVGSLSSMIQTLRDNCHAKRIVVDIDGSGGAIIEAFRLYGALRAHSGKVECRVQRNACSAATLILSAGDVRAARRSATLTVHGLLGHDEINKALATAIAASTGGDFHAILQSKMAGPVRNLTPGFQHHEQVIGFDEAQRLGYVNKQLAMPASRDMLDSMRREIVDHGRRMIAASEQRMQAPTRKDGSSVIAQLEKHFSDRKANRRVRHT